MRLSKFLKLSNIERERLMSVQKKENKKLVDFLAYCLMPNHFHFLLKQVSEGGISRFMSNFQNSYTRYYNIKYERVGPLFLDKFKAIRIETDDQLLHVSRYIHLNPYSSFVVKKIEDLDDFMGSSLFEYLNDQEGICKKDYLLPFFNNIKGFKKFVWDQADYQRRLEEIKHLTLEE
jgi:putative transposase